MRKYFPGLLLVVILVACTQQTNEQKEETVKQQFYKPWEVFPELFHEVQMNSVFEDSKTFVDCVPLQDPELINELYQERKDDINFDLRQFVMANFALPETPGNQNFKAGKPFFQHLNDHWEYLTRSAKNPDEYSTLIALPNKYIVPGGRFREIYYWDSYFSMIGLAVSGRKDLVRSMLDNFAYQLDTIGYIPNGNRTYFLGRSQPPFFGAMVNLYANMTNDQYASEYLDILRKEYDFWMKGQYEVNENNPSSDRVVYYQGYVLNRYYDNAGGPREESYKEDVELAEIVSDKDSLFLNLRAACESGWDFSARWFENPDDFTTIRTTEILPVDLNSLLYHTELTLSRLYGVEGDDSESQRFVKAAENRYNAMNEVFWNEKASMFQDILWQKGTFTGRVTAASFYPLYFKLSNKRNADQQTPVLLDSLFSDGGILTSTIQSGQQWDSPNGWAPLNWMAYKGLQHYDFEEEADSIRTSWININRKVYATTGKMMEKYNVIDTTLAAGGGEYPNQDGFGWTNGVALGMEAEDPAY